MLSGCGLVAFASQESAYLFWIQARVACTVGFLDFSRRVLLRLLEAGCLVSPLMLTLCCSHVAYLLSCNYGRYGVGRVPGWLGSREPTVPPLLLLQLAAVAERVIRLGSGVQLLRDSNGAIRMTSDCLVICG